MWRKDEQPLAPGSAQPAQIVEGAHRRGLGGGDVKEDNIGPFDAEFGRRDEQDAAFASVRERPRLVKHLVVERHREDAEALLRRMVDEFNGRVVDLVEGVFGGVEVQVGLDPVPSIGGRFHRGNSKRRSGNHATVKSRGRTIWPGHKEHLPPARAVLEMSLATLLVSCSGGEMADTYV